MSIRKKILIYFSLSITFLLGAALFFIYTFFSQYREEEFQQRQKLKISNTLKILAEVKEADEDLIEAIDRLNIHELFDEKLLIFNKDKQLIYSSIDDTPISYSESMVHSLSEQNPWIEKKDGLYDVIGAYVLSSNNVYYGISKAYDSFGYTKLNYLRYVLVSTFFGIVLSVILISYLLAGRITNSITDLTRKIKNYNFDKQYIPLETKASNDEIALLTQRFNELMKKMSDAFSFQKHAVHHISHELKTPISVLVSNFERIEKETDLQTIQLFIEAQKEDTKNLSEIINSLLEISKAESGNALIESNLRIDELIFDIAEELNSLYPNFQFTVDYAHTDDEANLSVAANKRLLKAALMNLMLNCIQYSLDNHAKISISGKGKTVQLIFENNGMVISENEKQFLFQHFFRGENSKGKRGFGLGLVFIHKILSLHGGSVAYSSENNQKNIFTVSLPLS